MKVVAQRTPIVKSGDNLFKIIDEALLSSRAQSRDLENSVLAISSSVVATCEGRVVEKKSDEQKDMLIEQESEWYLPRQENPYNVSLTITNGILAASAGIDESNSNGNYVLWPKDPQKSANAIREHLVQKFKLEHVGVILTDSKTTPLRWGVTGIALSYSGFKPLHNLIGHPDIFGKPLEYTQVSVIDNLACAAILEMGESDEQTPLAVISDIRQIEFVDHNPTQEEIQALRISMDEDLYGTFLKSAPWRKGKRITNK